MNAISPSKYRFDSSSQDPTETGLAAEVTRVVAISCFPVSVYLGQVVEDDSVCLDILGLFATAELEVDRHVVDSQRYVADDA